MKVALQITLVAITIMLAACTTAPFAPVETEAPTPTQIVPTSTLTPTLAPTLTATPLPEYKAGITPDMEYEDCNQLHEDTLTVELTELVAKEHAWLDAQGVTADMIRGHGMSSVKQLPLSPYAVADFPTASQYLTSCSVLHMNNGKDMFLLGIAVKNNTSDNIAILHFGIDDTGMQYIAKEDPNYTAQYQNYVNSRTFFDRIKNYTTLDEFYHIIPRIFIPFQYSEPYYFKPWQNTVKYMDEYYKGGSIIDYYKAIAWNADEKAIINILETMVIPTMEIIPKYP